MKTRAFRRMASFSWIALAAVLGCAASATGNDTLGQHPAVSAQVAVGFLH